MFEKKLFRVFATSTSSDVILPLFTKVLFSLDLILAERRGLTVYQNFLLSVISFHCMFAKYFFYLFSEVIKTFYLLCIT